MRPASDRGPFFPWSQRQATPKRARSQMCFLESRREALTPPVHRRLPHIKGRAEIQNTERGEKHRLGHADRPALQHGGREHSEDDESGVEDIDAADNPRAPVRRRVGLDRRK